MNNINNSNSFSNFQNNEKEKINTLRLKQMIIRFISSICVFTTTVFFTPNFNIDSFPLLLLSSIVVIILDFFMSVITGIHDIPLGRGLVGFTSAVIILYIAQFFISGYYISMLSSMIAAAIYGIIDYMLPNS